MASTFSTIGRTNIFFKMLFVFFNIKTILDSRSPITANILFPRKKRFPSIFFAKMIHLRKWFFLRIYSPPWFRKIKVLKYSRAAWWCGRSSLVVERGARCGRVGWPPHVRVWLCAGAALLRASLARSPRSSDVTTLSAYFIFSLRHEIKRIKNLEIFVIFNFFLFSIYWKESCADETFLKTRKEKLIITKTRKACFLIFFVPKNVSRHF